jgi:AraC family carnitine catabolism transcriptional activator
MRYYLRLRLRFARNAIFYGDQPIADIAYEHGFSCPEVFSRTFRAQFGLSPRAFRASVSQEQLRRFLPELSGDLAVSLSDPPGAALAVQ